VVRRNADTFSAVGAALVASTSLRQPSSSRPPESDPPEGAERSGEHERLVCVRNELNRNQWDAPDRVREVERAW
jgi:hypothetical protein